MATKTKDNDVDAEVERLVDEAQNPTGGNVATVEYDDPEVDEYETILPDYEDAIENAYVVAGGAVPKAELIGVPFAIYDFTFRQGNLYVDVNDKGKTMVYAAGGIPDRETGEIVLTGNKLEFVVVRAVTAPGHLRKPVTDDESEHIVFVDGGTGIYKSLRQLFDARGVVKVKCKRGLRVSSYTGPHGGESETYYL